MPHTCKAEKKHQLFVLYTGKWSATAPIRVQCSATLKKQAKDETLEKTIAVDTTKKAVDIRYDLYDKLVTNDNNPKVGYDEEINSLVFVLRAYKAACELLGVFIKDNDWVPFEYAAFNSSTAKECELLCDTIEDVIGAEAAARQRKTLTPEGRKAYDEKKNAKKRPEPKLPKMGALTLPKPNKPPTPDQIANKSILMVLTITGIGNRRKVSTDRIDVKESDTANKDWLSASKKLFQAEEFEAITSHDGKTRAQVEAWALPSQIKDGVYLVPFASVEMMDAYLEQRIKERAELVEQLCKVWPAKVAEAMKQLGTLASAGDYPNVQELRTRFNLYHRYIKVNTPATLEEISPKIFKREQQKAEQTWREAGEIAQALLRTNYMELVTHLETILTPEGQKKKVIRDSAVEKIKEFCKNFNPLNINDDNQLRALVDRGRELLQSVDGAALRQSDNVRDFVRDGFSEIKKVMSTMVTNKPKRAIGFEIE